ncbi:hypothetical protein L1887_59813 [Cichorium endivia]|nr:hypothetical protein L1887_59813 [Cichorium endivia]
MRPSTDGDCRGCTLAGVESDARNRQKNNQRLLTLEREALPPRLSGGGLKRLRRARVSDCAVDAFKQSTKFARASTVSARQSQQVLGLFVRNGLQAHWAPHFFCRKSRPAIAGCLPGCMPLRSLILTVALRLPSHFYLSSA